MKKILSILAGLMLVASLTFSQDIKQKVVVGYQGWFACAGDGNPSNKWYHWVPNSNTSAPRPGLLHFDLYPDMREYTKTYQTGFANLGNGQPAKLFSSRDAETVNKHVEWMQTYNIDVIALQRFVYAILSSSDINSNRTKSTLNIKNAAQTYGRKFYIMYDVSDWDSYDPKTTKAWHDVIKDDWTNTVTSSSGLNVLASSAYAKENNKPVVCIWGCGSTDRPGDESTWKNLISWFKSKGCYVIVGVNKDWRVDSGLQWAENAALTADMISPWSVGAYDEAGVNSYKTKLDGDFTLCKSKGVELQPVVWPGFSWANWNTGSQNAKPRNHGEFMWKMIYNAKSIGNNNLYVAMFDEVDEATAIFKAAENTSMRPTNQWFLHLSYDGTTCSSDFYLRLVQDARRMLRGDINPTTTHPTPHTITTVAVTGVTVSPTSATLNVNATQQLIATVLPTNATNKAVSWTSSNTTVATVSNGLVTAKATGSATITVRTNDGGKTATSAITVSSSVVSVTGVTVSPTSATINVGSSQTLTPTVLPSNATNKSVTWSSSNTAIATVSSTGVVTGVAAGSATITVRTNDAGKTATSTITITAPTTYFAVCNALSENGTWATGTGNTLTVTNSDVKEGGAALKCVGTANNEFKLARNPVYNSGLTESSAALKFWYYCSDVTKSSSRHIELGSGGVNDVNEYDWSLTTTLAPLVNGWNYIDIKVTSATKVGTPNLASLNWFRFYATKSASLTTKVDAIQVLAATSSSKSAPVIEKQSNGFTMYPNPLSSDAMLTISVKAEGTSIVKIYDMNGRMVYLKALDASNSLNINAKDILKSGLYNVSVISNDVVVSKQLIVR